MSKVRVGTRIKDIMTKKVISVYPDAPLTEVAFILAKHSFDGLPVVDHKNRLEGIITEYDLVSKSAAVHIPTFQKIIQDLPVFNKNRKKYKNEFTELLGLKAKDVMNRKPLTLNQNTTYKEAVKAFRDHHRVNPIPVTDSQRKVVGVISRFDILKPLRLAS